LAKDYYQNLRTIFAQLPESYREHLPRLRIIEETIASLPYDRVCRARACSAT
jgi:uncharacterized protein YecE (DUF72 family)